MDYPKFSLLLRHKCLYFTRVGVLRDQYEGHLTQADYDFLQDSYLSSEESMDLDAFGAEIDAVDEARDNYYVNCWHEGEDESVAMWKVYTKNGYGVAVQSDAKSLQGSIREVDIEDDSYAFDVEKVYYTSHFDLVAPFNRHLLPVLRKGTEYNFENEVRAYIKTDIEARHGIRVEVNLSQLILDVVISPEAEEWYFNLVCDVMGKHGLHDKPVRRSVLDRPPRP